MSYQEKLKEYFELSSYDDHILSEEEAETLLTYLYMYNYKKSGKSGWVYPHGGHFWELTGPDGLPADIYFNNDDNEVLLIEYASVQKHLIHSQTKFVSKTRRDYIRNGVTKDLLYSCDGFNRTDYVKEENLREYFAAFRRNKEIDPHTSEFTIHANLGEDECVKIMNIKALANRIRKVNEATKNQEL